MGVRYLITSLANFGSTVSAIQNSYDLDKIPEKLSRAMLPALIPLPEIGSETGFATLSFLGNSPQQSFEVTHLCLYAEADTLDTKRALPGLLTLLDGYITAAKNQRTLDTQPGPTFNQVVMQFGVEIGITQYGDVRYHSLAFKHKMTIYL
jgi:hypothetical protein